MSDALPAGAKIPCTFEEGQPLTAEELNRLQSELLGLILSHTHAGNGAAPPQGVQLGSDAIAAGAIKSEHIRTDSISRGHIRAGAVGASELGEKQVGANHLNADAVTTPAIRNGNVTLDKLSDDIKALLNAPRQGATTYCYCTYLPGTVAFPVDTNKKWSDWLTVKDEPIRLHDIPVTRLREDGGIQPIITVMPAADFKLDLPIFRSTIEPMTSFAANTFGKLEGETASEPAAKAAKAAKAASVPAPAPKAMSFATNTALSDNLTERSRITMEIDADIAGISSGNAVKKSIVLNPGTGGNAPFSDKNEPIVFANGIEPSAEMKKSFDQILYNYGIDLQVGVDPFQAGLDKLIDFVNNPHLLPVGYWTGAARNIDSVIRMKDDKTAGKKWIRIKFAVPYASESGYVVSVMPETKDADPKLLIPMVLHRSTDYVDIAFQTLDSTLKFDYVDTANFNVVIQGELKPGAATS
jgi:hypothetical protein